MNEYILIPLTKLETYVGRHYRISIEPTRHRCRSEGEVSYYPRPRSLSALPFSLPAQVWVTFVELANGLAPFPFEDVR